MRSSRLNDSTADAGQIAANLDRVTCRISDAAERSGRDRDAVQLIAITKYVAADVARLLHRAGCLDLGESRPQVLWEKAETLKDLDVRWHMIGHLQRNKVRRTLAHLHLIHSVDSRRLLDELDTQSADRGEGTKVLVEVNTSGEGQKGGFSVSEAERLASEFGRWDRIDVCGLMTMSARDSDATSARREFACLRELRDRMQRADPQLNLRHLSMGMSRDFEAAILEGATMVRIGSALFEGISR